MVHVLNTLQIHSAARHKLSRAQLWWTCHCATEVTKSHVLLSCFISVFSTFILAFVKSEGKAVKTDETKPLLSQDTDSGKGTTRDSIIGDLRDKLVRKVHFQHYQFFLIHLG